jgi:hypothetical protein
MDYPTKLQCSSPPFQGQMSSTEKRSFKEKQPHFFSTEKEAHDV